MARLTEVYKNDVAPALMQKYSYKSPMQIPKIDKVVINVGTGGDERDNAKAMEAIVNDITAITGQKAVVTRAKKSDPSFAGKSP